jgi:acetyl-CoA synthetase
MQPINARDVYYDELIADESDDPASCPCEPMDAEDLLFLLYTSGTTGKPKGVVHTTGGYLTGVTTTTNLVFDVKPDSVYWCAADIGWVTGHSYIVYGPLANGIPRCSTRAGRCAGPSPPPGCRSSAPCPG